MTSDGSYGFSSGSGFRIIIYVFGINALSELVALICSMNEFDLSLSALALSKQPFIYLFRASDSITQSGAIFLTH